MLVAVSGGADSVALASLLAGARGYGLPLELVLAHLDHGWRGREEARLDHDLVTALARLLDLPLVVAGPPDPPAEGEEAARRWRYATLARLAHGRGATKVAVGHHLRDQAETFLLRLLRGSGAFGLAAMAPARPLDAGRLTVVRPLLSFHPDALKAWNRAQGHAWREDVTNQGPGARNDVRRRLLLLEARHADASVALADLAARLRRRVADAAQALDLRLARGLERHGPGSAVAVARALLAGLGPEDLALALRALGRPLHADELGPWFTRRHLDLVARAVLKTGAVDLPCGLALRVTPGKAWLLRREGLPPLELLRRDLPRAEFDLAAFVSERPPFTAALDADVLGRTARLKPLEAGDHFRPLGLSGEPVRVRAWLARRGVPAGVRRAGQVVVGERGVAWAVGERIDGGHAVLPATRRVALLEVVRARGLPDSPGT